MAAPTATGSAAAALTVLVVDDDSLVLFGTSAMIEDLGHTPLEARSGAEALEVLGAATAVDLVVTDQGMPGMTGLELAARIRELSPDLPVILATGYGDLSMEDGESLPLLAKPFGLDQLRLAIDAALRRG